MDGLGRPVAGHEPGQLRVAVGHLDRKRQVADILEEAEEDRDVVVGERLQVRALLGRAGVGVAHQVREAARKVRDRLSLDSWRVINRLEDVAEAPQGDPLVLLAITLVVNILGEFVLQRAARATKGLN